ncbi:hypothetical protein E2C01_033688 [Portunus trituberculatus]|uniref:Uncharacterized protein n=1 Tax=Portunus trituberculatus TaxID=210409 RepID=A0A5B7F4V1_PORTR|nr:hypothetical protein [Portunus trituberculatus]
MASFSCAACSAKVRPRRSGPGSPFKALRAAFVSQHRFVLLQLLQHKSEEIVFLETGSDSRSLGLSY